MRDSREAHRSIRTDPPRLAGWKSLCHWTFPRLTSLVHDSGTAAGFHRPSEALGMRALARPRSFTRIARIPASRLGEELQDENPRRLSSCFADRASALASLCSIRIVVALRKKCDHAPRTVSLRPSRRARQRVPSSFTSAETVFLRSFERGDGRDTCCRRMPPTT